MGTKIDEKLKDYVEVMQEIAIQNERHELGIEDDIYVYECRMEYFQNIANKNEINYFKINDNYDINDIIEYCLYLENKVSKELLDEIKLLVLYK